MRTTLTINEELLEKTKTLSDAKTKNEAIEIALEEFVRREKSKKLIELEGKVELSFSLSEFLKRRKGDVSHRSSVWIWYNFTKSNIWQNQGL